MADAETAPRRGVAPVEQHRYHAPVHTRGGASTRQVALLTTALALGGCDALGSLLGSPSGSAKPADGKPTMDERCSLEHELSDDERYAIQQAIDDGQDPCPMWAAPELRLDGKGMWLHGEEIDDRGYATSNIVLIQSLLDKLKTNRERWRSVHPNQPFPGTLRVTVGEGARSDAGISALASASYAGYPNFEVEADGETASFRWHIPGRAGARPGHAVFIERIPLEGYQVGIDLGEAGGYPPPARHLAKVADEAALAAWFEEHCQGTEGSPCAEWIRIRAQDGSFADTMRVVRSAIGMPGLAKTKPGVMLGFRCHPPRGFMGYDEIVFPWGPRSLDEDTCEFRPQEDDGDDAETDTTDSEVSGRLAPEAIQRVVRQNFGRLRQCYEGGRQKNPTLEGRVNVRFTITRDGRVSNVSTDGDMPDQRVIACVGREFRQLRFPEPDGGIVTVRYPIVFTLGE